MAKNVLELLIKVTDRGGVKTLRNLRTELDKTGKRAGVFRGTMMGVFAGNLLTAGARALTNGIRALGGQMADSVKLSADLEQQVANTAAVMGKSVTEVSELKDLITDLGIDPKLKVTATEAGEAINMLARNGVSLALRHGSIAVMQKVVFFQGITP